MSDFFYFDDDWIVVAQESLDDVIAVQFWHRNGGPSVPTPPMPDYPQLSNVPIKELELA